ncbi:MAG: CYTH domain-containing protein [Flavobacteriaceae bacterium]|jgi:CYTH domain-containing protein|nr:CYTH domain-containing protein [Flavobacteriaceae bacterium]
MKPEIERKFLLTSEQALALKAEATHKKELKQGYLAEGEHVILRVRISDQNAYLTIKEKVKGSSRLEFETPVELSDAEKLLDLCSNQIKKTRHLIKRDYLIELDEFHAANEGLWLAEIEFDSIEESNSFISPVELGKEVTDDYRYYNSYLVDHPYTGW